MYNINLLPNVFLLYLISDIYYYLLTFVTARNIKSQKVTWRNLYLKSIIFASMFKNNVSLLAILTLVAICSPKGCNFVATKKI